MKHLVLILMENCWRHCQTDPSNGCTIMTITVEKHLIETKLLNWQLPCRIHHKILEQIHAFYLLRVWRLVLLWYHESALKRSNRKLTCVNKLMLVQFGLLHISAVEKDFVRRFSSKDFASRKNVTDPMFRCVSLAVSFDTFLFLSVESFDGFIFKVVRILGARSRRIKLPCRFNDL